MEGRSGGRSEKASLEITARRRDSTAKGCPVGAQLRDLTRRGLRGHPGALRGFLASLPQGSWGRTHIVLGGVPPFLHVHHGGILHAVGEHLPPTKRVAPPGGVTFSSRSGPGSLSRFPGPRVSPATSGRRAAARAPQAHRYSRWAGAVQRARGLRAPGRLPVGLPRSPSLPRRRSSPARPPALSAARWVRRELAEQRRGGGVSRRRGDGAGAPEPAVSALGRGRQRPFSALRLRGARR